MKSISVTLTDEVKEVATTTVPVKVCIHILGEARGNIRTMRTATTLLKDGFLVSIVDVEAERRHPIKEDIDGVHMEHILVPSWYSSRHSQLRFFFTAVQTFILSLLRLFRSRVDIYHAVELTTLPACLIVAALRRKPLIFEVYDLQFPVPETYIGFWRRLGGVLTCFQALVVPRCAGVIVTSPLHGQEICNRFHIPTVQLVRNIPPYRTVLKSDRLRQHLGLSPAVRIALYQGTLDFDRQLDRLVRAAPYLERDIVIVMMGKGPEGTGIQRQLEALITTEGVADRVKIIPPVPYEELLDWTVSADIGLIIYSPDYSPNVQFCLPNKLFEFLMAGLPVLAAQLDAIAEVIRTYDVGRIVSSLTSADIGTAINTMLADSETLDRLRRNALKVAQQELNWEKESQELIRFYHDIMIRQRRKERT